MGFPSCTSCFDGEAMRRTGFCPKVLAEKWKNWIPGAFFATFFIFATIGFIQNQHTLQSFIYSVGYRLGRKQGVSGRKSDITPPIKVIEKPSEEKETRVILLAYPR